MAALAVAKEAAAFAVLSGLVALVCTGLTLLG